MYEENVLILLEIHIKWKKIYTKLKIPSNEEKQWLWERGARKE